MIRALPLLALTACFGPEKLDTDAPYPEDGAGSGVDGGGDAGTGDGVSLDDTNDTAPATTDSVVELSGACGEAAAEAFTCAYADEVVTCTHTGFVAATCGHWTAEAAVSDEAHTVQIAYQNDGASGCPDTCPWDFSYVLPPMASGDWSITAGAADIGDGSASAIHTTVTVP